LVFGIPDVTVKEVEMITTKKSENGDTYFAPRRIGHVNLWVDDIDRSETFYHDVCGLMVEFTEPDLQATFLGVGHTAHDLGMMKTTGGKNRYGRDGSLQLPGTVGLKVGLNHVAWELVNEAELVAAFQTMQRNGVKHDMTLDHQIAHSLYMFDPDGNYNEFYCDTIEDWRSVLKGEMGLISGIWDPDAADAFKDSRYPKSPKLETNSSAPLKPKRITHLVIETKNYNEMFEFYTKIGGLRVLSKVGAATYLSGSISDYDFSLILLSGNKSQYRHASFELENEMMFERSEVALKEKGLQIEKTLHLPWKRSIFLRDPDGLLSEWYVKRPVARTPSIVDSELFPYAA
jgi:catechol 2,3-dioxygenase